MIENSKIDKVFILTNTLKNGGTEKQSILLANALKEKYDTLLIVYYGSEFDEKLRALSGDYGINVIWLSGSHIKRLIFLFNLFRMTTRSIVFSYLATTNLINAIIGSLAGVKYRIGGIRNSELSKSKTFLQKILHNYLLTYSVFNNYSGKTSLVLKGFKGNKAFVIHNGIEIKISSEKKLQKKQYVNILSIGRFVEQKDYFTSIKSIERLLILITDTRSKQEVRFTIIGYGQLEDKIRNYISEMNLNEQIEIIINPPRISEYLEVADIYLSTSLYEGLSNSIMEAMEYSLPIVATNVGDNNKLIREGYNGFLVPIKAINDISLRLFELIQDKILRAEMGINSYNFLKENYSIEALKQNYINFIHKLVDD